ncbi:hypothetical protein GCM10007932_33190 [Vibrio penaeicida]|uniref:Na(+)/drug antiporter n=1 Tax=Vibrio penaeicida TaxID=104609 RepID=A0AAV5NTS2_9VIBR|nr:hypothetical protein GCM10007932_33190 [Vibrio penaeicida]
MGLKGAAIATLIAAGFEALCIFVYLYASKHLLAFKARDLFASLRPKYIRQFWTLSLPTTFNFLVWAGGLFTYTAIMGQASDIGLVALAVMIPIESVALALLVGTANASSVIVGNQIGAKDYNAAYYQAVIFTVAAIVLTLCVAVALYLLRTPILNTFTSLSAEARLLAETFYTILCFGIVLRSLPTNMVVGVLRAGGDVRFCLYQDIFTQWFFGIPIAAFCALFIGLPPEVIYATFFLETLFKWVACLYRFRSKKWIHQLAH